MKFLGSSLFANSRALGYAKLARRGGKLIALSPTASELVWLLGKVACASVPPVGCWRDAAITTHVR
jgi:hypothetical protein